MDPLVLAAMHAELVKLSTQGYGAPPPHDYEEMDHAKWIQTAKDVPVILAGGALGYGLSLTAAQYLAPKMVKSPEALAKVKSALPWVGAGASGLGAYLALQQQHQLHKRREAASAAAQPPPPAEPPKEAAPKQSSAIVPNVGARRTDPWREDRRYPKFLG